MTTLSLTNIPSNINTLEKLHLWTVLALRDINGAKSIVEAEGYLPERLVQAPIIETPNAGQRFILRTSIELDLIYTSDKTKKLWEHAKELTVGPMPASYLSN
jgi:hypothetical protein